MLIPIHNHFNARMICEIDVEPALVAKLNKPPPLKDAMKAEAHIVEVSSSHGLLRLFRARVNGSDLYMTNTPAVALLLAA